jgi:putative RNA 2'-phosphotransferase
LSEDGLKIRASQGHSIEIELNYVPAVPPDILYHGTAEKNLAIILESGLVKMNRHHVHLSVDKETAKKVGARHGKPVILSIEARKMYEDGKVFYVSDNGVWLVDAVEAVYLGNEIIG